MPASVPGGRACCYTRAVQLHRIITIAGFVPDPDWSSTQAVPPLLDGTSPPDGEELVQVSGAGLIYWTAIPYNGNVKGTSLPSSGAGLTFDARLVYATPGAYRGGAQPKLVVGRKSPGEVEGAPIKTGREVIESAIPTGASGVLQMLSLAGAPPPGTTHLWLFYRFVREGTR